MTGSRTGTGACPRPPHPSPSPSPDPTLVALTHLQCLTASDHEGNVLELVAPFPHLKSGVRASDTAEPHHNQMLPVLKTKTVLPPALRPHAKSPQNARHPRGGGGAVPAPWGNGHQTTRATTQPRPFHCNCSVNGGTFLFGGRPLGQVMVPDPLPGELCQSLGGGGLHVGVCHQG